MGNPDAPIIHHGVGNIPAADLAMGKLGDEPSVFVPYFGPNPPIGFINFTYVYQIYAQPGKIEYPELLDSFRSFPAEQFAANYNLELLEQNYWLTEKERMVAP